MTIPQNIIDIIKKDNIGNINMVWARDTNWYEVSVGLYNII